MQQFCESSLVLQRLRSLGWARVDCAWRDARLGSFAHNHIQVTRGWLNFEVRCSSPSHGTLNP